MTDLNGAIRRAEEVLWSSRGTSGAWDARSDVGPASTANVLVTLGHLGVLTADERSQGTAWLRRHQRPDGSFIAYPFATEGDLSVTAQCWAALVLAEDPQGREAAAKAKAYVYAHGGPEAVRALMKTGDIAAIYLAVAGLMPPDRLPAPPLIWSLFDPFVYFLSGKVHFGILMGSLELGLISRDLRGRFHRRNFLERAECDKAIELLGLYQNPDGSWNGNTVQTATAMLGLFSAGMKVQDDRLARSIAWMRSRKVIDADGMWFDVFSSDVWTTAFYLRSLLLSGVSRQDPRLVRALEWLLSQQLEVPQPWPNNRDPSAVRTGGWPFQTGNVTMADTDDTGVVLTTLALALQPGDDGAPLDPQIAANIHRRTDRGIAFLRAMQNDDGGWGAFVHDVPKVRAPGPLYLKPLDIDPDNPIQAFFTLLFPPQELGDPSTEDLAGRVLHGVGHAGLALGDPLVDGALTFVRRMQEPNRGWWARWLTNYLAATSYVVTGALAVGEARRTPYLDAGVRFLLEHQNEDGGWGEGPASYVDPKTMAGVGPSSAPLTGMVTAALIEAGRADEPAVARAIDYLLREQLPDGTWPNGTYVVTNIPPNNFYTYAGAVNHLPLEALARYRMARRS